MNFWSLLTDIGILLTASLVLGAVLMRIGLNPLIGFITAGIFLGGPGSLHLIHSPLEIETIAELGVSLLLFSLGLEFSLEKLKSFSKSTIYGGLAQIVLTPLIIFSIGYFLKFELKLVIFFALIITLSSTATVLRSLVDLHEIDSPHGRNATAVLLLQDIAVIPFTVMISLLISAEANNSEGGLLYILLSLAILVIGLYLLLNKIAVPVLSMFTLEKNRELSIILATVIAIGSAWAAHQAGISPAIGAFIAGMMLGSSPFATQITADVSPLRIIFLTLFFGSVGMVANPIWIMSNITLVISLTLAVIAAKVVISFCIFKLVKNTVSISIASAIAISQIGEFAFVLSTIAKDGNLVTEYLYQIIFSVTIMSILFTAITIKYAAKLGLIIQNIFYKNSYDSKIEEVNKDKDQEPLIFILGFGPTGQEIAKVLLENNKKNIRVIDLSNNCIEKARSLGLKASIGDIRQAEVMQHFGIQDASQVFITVPSQEAALSAVYNVKQISPCSIIFVRSRYQIHERLFAKAGAHHVVSEELTTGDILADLSLTKT